MHFKLLRSRYFLPVWPLLLLLVGMSACTAERTQKAEAPDIDVDVDPGQWPRYNVKWADVDVGTTERTVSVPKIEVKREQVQMNVPYIDINPPGAKDREERAISMEVEVPNPGYNLRITEVRAAGDRLWVVGELTQTGEARGAPTRVYDQIVVRAPEDLNVQRVLIGQRPEGVYNEQYRFFGSRAELDQRLPSTGRVLYQRPSA